MVELTVNMYRVHLKSFALLSQLSELVSGVFGMDCNPGSFSQCLDPGLRNL